MKHLKNIFKTAQACIVASSLLCVVAGCSDLLEKNLLLLSPMAISGLVKEMPNLLLQDAIVSRQDGHMMHLTLHRDCYILTLPVVMVRKRKASRH